MRTTLLAAAATTWLAATAAAAAPPIKGKQFPYSMTCDRLENGLTVCRVPFNSPGLVAYYTAMRVGSRNEVEAGHSGFAHFFEHMMFRGTKKWPKAEREKFIAQGGFNDNAYTSSDITVYNTFGPNTRLLELIEIEADRFQNLEYLEPAFQTEALAVLGEYHKNAANPLLKLSETLADTAYEKHTYKHTTMGFYADIKKMPEYYEYSKQFFQRWYTPDNAIIFVVGDFDEAKVMQAIRAHYASWKGKAAQVEIPKEPPQSKPKQARIDWETPTLSRHVIAWKTPATSLDNTDAAVRSIVADYLVGQTSPLYRELVLDKQLAEQLFPFSGDNRDPSLMTLMAILKKEEARPEVHAAFEREVKALAAGKIDAQRVKDIQSNTRYGILMSLESPAQVANLLARWAGILGAPDALDRHLGNIAKVKPEQLVAFAKKHLTDSNRTVVELATKQAGAQGGAQ